MKVVFDENVPWPLRKLLSDYAVTSVQREGLGGAKNGELLEALDGKFDVFILCDKNLRYQQNLKGRQTRRISQRRISQLIKLGGYPGAPLFYFLKNNSYASL